MTTQILNIDGFENRSSDLFYEVGGTPTFQTSIVPTGGSVCAIQVAASAEYPGIAGALANGPSYVSGGFIYGFHFYCTDVTPASEANLTGSVNMGGGNLRVSTTGQLIWRDAAGTPANQITST